MPIVEVVHDPRLQTAHLQTLADVLPQLVSLAVECPEEPYDGVPNPGDVDIRFRPRGPHDFGGLDVVVEVRSKWFASRAETRQERCDQLCAQVMRAVETVTVGVYVSLPIAAWAQSD